MYYTVYIRSNWSSSWTKVQHGIVTWSGSNEQLSDGASVTVQMTSARLSETSTSNIYRMYSEVRIDETDHDGYTFTRYHGFISEVIPSVNELQLKLVDFLGLCNLLRPDVPASSADIIRMGTDAAPVEMISITESGEDRWIPDPDIYPQAYIGGVPDDPPANRRQWKAVAGIRDDGNDEEDYPDHLVPPAQWQMGTDLLNYLQFIGYTPLGNVTVEFLVVYEEDTNQLEDILINAFSVILPNGPELVAGVHYNNTSSDYYVRTIWPSLITVNEWKWHNYDGTLAEMVDQLLSAYAPPNYRVWWDHENMMLRCQYVELLPFDTDTSYYQAGSYPYGRVVSDPPDAEDDDDYVDATEVESARTVTRSVEKFRSEIIVSGTNEWPQNAIEPSMVTTLEAYWPAGWTTDGSIADMLDRDFGTEFKIWNESASSSPAASITDTYYPMLHVNFGAETILERLRMWMPDSRRDFPFELRVEAHNDSGYSTYDPDAPWEPMHPDLWDRRAKPFELVEASGTFLRSICRCVLISMKPTKIHLKYTFAGGLSDMEFIRSSTISGRAYVIGTAPGVGWTLIQGAGGTGSWYQKVGVKENDGEAAVLLPYLYQQLCSRSTIANKLVAGHRSDIKENNSLGNTNQCALEAARILMETLRDARKFDLSFKSRKAAQKYRTIKLVDWLFGIQRNALIESVGSDTPGVLTVSSTAYGYSDSNRAGAWTSEEPLAL